MKITVAVGGHLNLKEVFSSNLQQGMPSGAHHTHARTHTDTQLSIKCQPLRNVHNQGTAVIVEYDEAPFPRKGLAGGRTTPGTPIHQRTHSAM